MNIDQREDRLPVWAKRQLDTLRMRLREANDDLTARSEGAKAEGCVVWLDRYSKHPVPVAGPQKWVTFTDDIESMRDWVSVQYLSNGVIEVMASGSCVIRPHVTNVVRIEVCK